MTKIKLNVSIFGEFIDFAELNDLLKLVPTSFWNKGDEILGRNKLIYRKESCWELSYGFINTLFLDDLLNLFYADFLENADLIGNYIINNDLCFKIDIVIEIVEDVKPSLYFERTFLELVSKMNGEIDIDMYIIR